MVLPQVVTLMTLGGYNRQVPGAERVSMPSIIKDTKESLFVFCLDVFRCPVVPNVILYTLLIRLEQIGLRRLFHWNPSGRSLIALNINGDHSSIEL